ncbi:MAG: glycosyltransferase family 2 protein [Vulcanimicrobiota bacterium]
MKLSIVSPVFAEGEVVRELVSKLIEVAGEKLLEIIIVISPKSPPESKSLCESLAGEFPVVKVHTQKKFPGVGYAYRDGFELANGTHILMIDSDGEMDVSTVPLLLKKMEETGADMVVGSRWAPGGGAVGYDPLKYFLNRGYQILFQILFWTKIHDLTFGFKLMKVEVARSVIWTAQFQDIGVETTLKPIKAGFHVEEIPTVWRSRSTGATTNNFLRNFRYIGYAMSILTASPKSLKKE